MQEPSSPKLHKKEMGEEEKEVEGVWSEMLALRRLYRFLHREGKDHTPSGEEMLDGTSRSLLKKLLDDATRQVIQSQDKPLSDLEAPPMATPSIPTEGATREAQHSAEHQECEPNATPGVAETVVPVLVKADDQKTTEPEPAKGLDPKQVAMEIRRPTQHYDHLRHGHNRHRRHYRPSKLNLHGLPSRKVEALLTRQHTQPSHVAEFGKEKRHLERSKSAKAKSENGNEDHHHRKAKQLAPRGRRAERSRVRRHADPIPGPERTAEMGDGSARGNRRPRVKLAGKGRARLGEFGDASSSRSRGSFDGGDSTRSNSFGSRSARGRDRVGRVPRRVSLRRVRSPSLPRGRRAASRCESLRPQRTRPVESHSFKFRGKGREEEGRKGGRLSRLKDRLAVILHHHHYHHHHHHHHHRKDGDGDGERHGHHRFSRLLRKLIHRKGEERHAMEMHGEHEAERRSGGRRGHGHFRALVQGLMQHLRRRREKRKARKERERLLKDGSARVHGARESKRLHWWQMVRRLGGVKLTRRRKPRLMLGPGTGRRPQRKLPKES